MTIFVSVAAYRDLELIPTLLDCVRRARYPADLHFGVCWQHAADEQPPPDLAPARLSLIDVPWRESGGACWARAEVMKLWDGEDWFFQIDSHHRFVQDWDVLLMQQAALTGSAKPLLTTYATAYNPALPLPETGNPTAMQYAGFTAEGVPVFDSRARPEWVQRPGPVRARCLSGHLLFTPGQFAREVPYDPGLYFYGEESTLAVRAFTHGYDLYHPSIHVMWHQWPRRVTPMHWDDHAAPAGTPLSGAQRDAASKQKVRRLLTQPTCDAALGPFGYGTARTVAEFEAYAGVNFGRCRISPAARHAEEPPRPPSCAPGHVRDWPVRLALDRAALPSGALEQPAFWYVAFHDVDGTEVARLDANRPELHSLLARPSGPIVLERQVRSARPPVRWTVRPTDRRRRWLAGLHGTVDSTAGGL